MKKLFLAAVIGCMGAAANAEAAPLNKSVSAISPAYGWTGFYVGINAGYARRADSAVTDFSPNDLGALNATCSGVFVGTCALPMSYDANGGIVGGIQAGYNWQLNPKWMAGIETDFNATGMKGSGVNPAFGLGPFAAQFRGTQAVDWFGTVRARIGFLPTDRLMIYGTGGFAYGRTNENIALDSSAGQGTGTPPYSYHCASDANCFVGSSSRIATGWTAGAGFEHKFWRNVSLKGEYLYVDLGGGNTNVMAQETIVPTHTPSSFTASHSSVNFHVFRVGLNLKLGE